MPNVGVTFIGETQSSLRRALPLVHRSYGLMRRSRNLSPTSALASFAESSQVAICPCCSRDLFRGCSYSFMFRPPSLFASRVAPTAASSLAGQLRRLHPSRTCIVTLCTHRICYPSDYRQLAERGLSPRKIHSIVDCSSHSRSRGSLHFRLTHAKGVGARRIVGPSITNCFACAATRIQSLARFS